MEKRQTDRTDKTLLLVLSTVGAIIVLAGLACLLWWWIGKQEIDTVRTLACAGGMALPLCLAVGGLVGYAVYQSRLAGFERGLTGAERTLDVVNDGVLKAARNVREASAAQSAQSQLPARRMVIEAYENGLLED